MDISKSLSVEECQSLLHTLQIRFEKNKNRHQSLVWENLQIKLENQPQKLWTLNEMEKTGGEPDVVKYDKETNEYIFYDCSSESPLGRRMLCYDRQALESRKDPKPQNTAMDMAHAMGIKILTENQYAYLQELGNFDTKTSSWIHTPNSIRELGGALFCDRRYHHVFVYHNGAGSYYSVRGFRGCLKC